MYNDFVLVGPAHDPADLKGADVFKALIRLTETEERFISRGDDSGTHKKEAELWRSINEKPEGDWYLSVGRGMGDTLVMADELQAYSLSYRGTYASMKDRLSLVILVPRDECLLNGYGLISNYWVGEQ